MGWMFRGRSIGLSQAVGVPSCEVTDTDSAADQPEAAAAPRRSGHRDDRRVSLARA